MSWGQDPGTRSGHWREAQFYPARGLGVICTWRNARERPDPWIACEWATAAGVSIIHERWATKGPTP